jgi:hypothetical protein
MQSRQKTQIGQHFVVNDCISHGTDSSVDLEKGNFGVLLSRFRTQGYLAFSSFFSKDAITPVLDAVLSVVRGTQVSFEANLNSGFGDARGAKWRALGSSDAMQQLYTNAKLQQTIKSILSQDPGLVVPENVGFQLSWIRGKGKGDGTNVHVDYYHVDPDQSSSPPRVKFEDVLLEGLFV